MVIPLLVYVFGFAQHKAQGTSLAMLLPPLGLLAAWRYYNAGHVDLSVAMLLAIGFFFGAPIGVVLRDSTAPGHPPQGLRRAAPADFAAHDLREDTDCIFAAPDA